MQRQPGGRDYLLGQEGGMGEKTGKRLVELGGRALEAC